MAQMIKFDDETERSIRWSLEYYEKWHELPNQQQQSALETFWEHKDVKTLNGLISKEEGYKKLVETAGKQAASIAMLDGLNRLVAQEIVKVSYGGVTSAAGRRGAVFIEEESARLAAAIGANVAQTGMKAIASLPVCITACIGEMVGDAIAMQMVITNHQANNAFGSADDVAAGAVAGGPIGVLAGVAVDAVSWTVGQGIKDFINVTKGPSDNWCFIKFGDIGNDELCVGTYAGSDTLYIKTYWKEYKKSNNEWEMSAGQSQTEVFQLCIWHNNRVIQHFNEVFYRDMFVVVKNGPKFRVVHCRGQHHKSDSGKVLVFEN